MNRRELRVRHYQIEEESLLRVDKCGRESGDESTR